MMLTIVTIACEPKKEPRPAKNEDRERKHCSDFGLFELLLWGKSVTLTSTLQARVVFREEVLDPDQSLGRVN